MAYPRKRTSMCYPGPNNQAWNHTFKYHYTDWVSLFGNIYSRIIINEIKARNFKENRKLYMGLSRGNKEKAEMCNYIIISRKQKKNTNKKKLWYQVISTFFQIYTVREKLKKHVDLRFIQFSSVFLFVYIE